MGHKCPAGLQCLNGYLAVVLAVAIYKATLTCNIKNHMSTARDAELCPFTELIIKIGLLLKPQGCCFFSFQQ